MPTIDLPLTPAGPIISVAVFVSVPRLLAMQAGKVVIPTPFIGIALLDTGASCTVIDDSVVAALGLVPTGWTPIHTPSTGSIPHTTNTYDVSLWFMQQSPFPAQPFAQPVSQSTPHPIHITLPVIEADLSAQNIQVLIGRDVLDRCHFTYDGNNGRYRLSY